MAATNQHRRFAVSVGLVLLSLSGLMVAQTGHLTKRHPQTSEYNPAPGWGRTTTLACIYLGEFTPKGAPNRIEVKENAPDSKGGMFEVDFIGGWPTSPKTLLVYPEGYSFIDASMAEDNMLMTSWSAADSGVFQVFHLVRGGATLVFEKSGWARIETWHSTVLVDHSAKGSEGKYHYTTTEFWQWNGKQYKLAATASYSQRLEALAKLDHEAGSK